MEVRRAKMPAGTILTVIGEVATVDGKKWHPVEPPPGDYRYIPKSAVQAERAVNTAFSVGTNDPRPRPRRPTRRRTAAGRLAAGAGAEPPPALPPKPAVDHPLWAKAEDLKKEGRADEAEKVYFELARKMNEPAATTTSPTCATAASTASARRSGRRPRPPRCRPRPATTGPRCCC